jgi:hypothetical protein
MPRTSDGFVTSCHCAISLSIPSHLWHSPLLCFFFLFACPDICFSSHAILLVIRAFVPSRVKSPRSKKEAHMKTLTSCYLQVPER